MNEGQDRHARIVRPGRSAARLLGAVTTVAVLGGGALVAAPPALAATAVTASAPVGDAFDGWMETHHHAGTALYGAKKTAGGRYSLGILSGSSATNQPVQQIEQTLPTRPGSTVSVTFNASASGAAQGSVQVSLGGTRFTVPGGTYGWRKVGFTAPVTSGTARLRITATGGPGRTWLDHFVVQGPGFTNHTLKNGGFEHNSRDLRLTNATLMLPQGAARLNIVSRMGKVSPFSWTLVNDRGRRVAAGRGRLAAHRATVPLTAPAGYYRFTIRGNVAGRSVVKRTDLAIVGPAPAASQAGLQLGIGLHLGELTDAQFARWMLDLKRIGLRYARTDIWWGDFERRAGVYTFPDLYARRITAMQRAGLRPLLIPGYRNPLYDGGRTPSSPTGLQAYAGFVAAVAKHYPGVDIDVYNEFDTHFADSACGHSSDCYLQLLKPASTSVRTTAPATTLSAPSIGGMGVRLDWLKPYIASGGLSKADALAFHPYPGRQAPESLDGPLAELRTVMAAHGGASKPMWFTEYGYSTSVQGVSEAKQAAYVSETMAISAKHGVRRIYWYDGYDDGQLPTDIESRFGLFRRPGSFAPLAWEPKPAAAAAAVAQRVLAGHAYAGTEPASSPAKVLRFGGGVRLIWSTGAPQQVRLPGVYRLVSATGSAVPATTAGGVTTVTATASPVYALPSS